MSDSNHLADFLKNYRTTEKSTVITHTIMPGGYKQYPWGKFSIPLDKQDELVKLLAEAVFRPGRPDDPRKNIALVECIPLSKIKPITLDFDFRYPINITTRQHTAEHLSHITNLIAEAVYYYLEVPTYEVHIFERASPYVDSKNNVAVLKDGIHFILPEVVCHVQVQHLIRNYLVQHIDDRVFKNPDIGILPLSNVPETIIDKGVIGSVAWMMYGASKPGKLPYELKKIIQVTNTNTNNDDEPFQLAWIPESNFPIDKAALIKRYRLSGKETQEIKIRPERSQDLTVEIPEVPKSILPSKRKLDYPAKLYNIAGRSQEQINKEKEEACKLIKIINSSRADDYNEWINMCWILRSISNDEDMYKLFLEFSRKSATKFDEGACEEQWKTDNGKDSKTIASLYRLAKIDNKKEFDEIRQSSLNEYVNYSLSGTTQDVANVIYQMFKDEYVCTSANGKEWFEFKNHRWQRCDAGISLRKKIGNEVLNLFLNVINFYNNAAISINNENDEHNSPKENCLYKAKALTEITYRLRDQPFKEKLMKECATMFYIKDWTTKLDSKLMLIGFENGVYDLNNNLFREGRPEDLISLSTGKHYIADVDVPEEIFEDIETFLCQIFPVPEVKHFVLKTMSSFLQGTNPDEKFHVWAGVGGNGKSKLLELLEQTLGEYAGKLSISMLTEKRPSSTAANPELARTRGKRICTFQEPDEGAKINIGLLKELTGGDKIICRGLFQEPFEMKPQFKLLLCCNHKPKIPPDEESTWRRFLIVEFISKFVHDPKEKNEFKRNDNLSTEKIPMWSQYFINLLIRYFYIYKEEGLKPPKEVEDATSEYRLESDEYLQFIKEHMTEDKSSVVKIEEVYSAFKAWYDTNYAPQKAKPRREFKSQMERKLKQPYYSIIKSGGWSGWRLKLFDNGNQLPNDIKGINTDDDMNESTYMSTGINDMSSGPKLESECQMTDDISSQVSLGRHVQVPKGPIVTHQSSISKSNLINSMNSNSTIMSDFTDTQSVSVSLISKSDGISLGKPPKIPLGIKLKIATR